MGGSTIPSQRILFLKTTSRTTNCSLLTSLSGIGIRSKVSWSNHSLVCFSIYKKIRKQCTIMSDGHLRNFLCEVFDSSKDSVQECRINEGKRCSLTKRIHYMEDCNVMITKKKPTPSKFMLYQSHLKLMMLCGFFTLQGAQLAAACSDIASQLSSISFLGETGDISTGFASALLAARNSSAVVFLGTFGALGAMTITSVIVGRTFHYVDDILPFRNNPLELLDFQGPRCLISIGITVKLWFGDTDLPVDEIAAACLLVYFGVSTLLEASSGDGLKAEEEQKEEKILLTERCEAELAVSEFSGNGAGIWAAAGTVSSTFLLVFVAAWGDKSFFSTIALAAASSPLGVVGGALAGHGVATLLAVLGGFSLGTFPSEKVIAYVGGTLFFVFAVVTLIEIVSCFFEIESLFY